MSKKGTEKEKSCESAISSSCGIFLRNFFGFLFFSSGHHPRPVRFTDKQLSWLLFIHQRLRNNNFVVFLFCDSAFAMNLDHGEHFSWENFSVKSLLSVLFPFWCFHTPRWAQTVYETWIMRIRQRRLKTRREKFCFSVKNFELPSSGPWKAKISL